MPRDDSKPDTKEFELRPGGSLVGPVLRGVRREGNPGTIPLNQFHHLQNVVFAGGDLESRGGQQVTGDEVDDCIPGIDGGDDDLLLIGLLVNEELGAGYFYNEDLTPPGYNLDMEIICNISQLPSGPRRVFCTHIDPTTLEAEDYCWGGSGVDEGCLWRLSIPANSTNPSTDRTWVRVVKLGLGVEQITSAIGVIWVSYTDGSVKYVDAARSSVTDAGNAGTGPVLIGQYREQVYAACEQEIVRWDGGTTWTQVSNCPDTVQFSPRCIRQVGDVLYVGGIELAGNDHPDPGDGQYQEWYYAYDGSTTTSHRFHHHDTLVVEDGVIDIVEYQGGVAFVYNRPLEGGDDQVNVHIENLNGDYVLLGPTDGDVSAVYKYTAGSALVAGGILFVSLRATTLAGPTYTRRLLKVDPDVTLFGSGAGTYFWRTDLLNNQVSSVATFGSASLPIDQAPADMVVVL